jgi:hypothetical protein
VIREHTEGFRGFSMADVREDLFRVLANFPLAYMAVNKMLYDRMEARKAMQEQNE